MANILIIHFSTISNVALTIPTVYSLAAQYPRHEVMVLGQDTLAPLFENLPDNVIFRGIDVRGEHAGLMGLASLYDELKEEHFHAVIDCRSTFRSKYLRWRFRLSGVRTACAGTQGIEEALRRMGYPVQADFVSQHITRLNPETKA